MLHGVLAKTESVVARGSLGRKMTVRCADEERHVFHSAQLPITPTVFMRARCLVFAPFIHGNAEIAAALRQ